MSEMLEGVGRGPCKVYLEWTSILNRESDNNTLSGFMLQKSFAAVLIQQIAIDIYFFVSYLDHIWIMFTVSSVSCHCWSIYLPICRPSIGQYVGQYVCWPIRF